MAESVGEVPIVKKVKFVAISDTHNHPLDAMNIPDADVIIHSGDATMRGTVPEVGKFARDFGQLKHKIKIFVAGNHDWLFQKEPYIARKLMEENGVTYLEDEAATIFRDGTLVTHCITPGPDSVVVWGSPWQPEFCNWAFNVKRGPDIQAKWDLIPAGIDVLVTHGPPYGILDRAPRGFREEDWGEQELEFYSERVGCHHLWETVKKIKPKVHVFGHIHADRGTMEQAGIKFINAAIMNENYDPTGKHFEFDL